MLIHTVKLFEEEDVKLEVILKRVSEVPMQLSDEPWLGLLWDSGNRRMLVSSENQRAALRVLFHGLGGNLIRLRSSVQDLKVELSGILGKQPDEITLPRWARIR